MVVDLSRELIESSVRGRFGRPFRFFESTDSTNERALEWLAEGAPEGALVAADQQTSGRGRRDRRWLADPGEGLLFSLVLRPTSRPALELLTTSLGVAVAEVVETLFALDARIKWPNDVTVGSKKIAGILVETRSGGDAAGGCVAGIGINVRTDVNRLPAEVASRATSILAALGPRAAHTSMERHLLLGAFLARFEEVYDALDDEGGRTDVVSRAALRSEVLGRSVLVRLADGGRVEGPATGLGASGELHVQTGSGEVSLRAGEVERLREADG